MDGCCNYNITLYWDLFNKISSASLQLAQRFCAADLFWWGGRTSNPLATKKRSGSIPPEARHFFSILLLKPYKFDGKF